MIVTSGDVKTRKVNHLFYFQRVKLTPLKDCDAEALRIQKNIEISLINGMWLNTSQLGKYSATIHQD